MAFPVANYFLVIGPAGLTRLVLAFQVSAALLTEGSWNVSIYAGVNDPLPNWYFPSDGATREARVLMLTMASATSNRDALNRIWNEYKVVA